MRAERAAGGSRGAWREFGRPLRAGLGLYVFVGGLLARQDGDVLREGVRVLAEGVMKPEVTGLIGAIPLEQDGESAVDERRWFSAESRKRLLTPALAAVEQDLLMAFAQREHQMVWALFQHAWPA